MSKIQAKILVIDDDADVLHTARFILKPEFESISTESNPNQLNYLIANEQYDVVLLDMNYTVGSTSGKEGLFWLKHIKENKPETEVVMMTAYGDLKLAVEAMKLGAMDFIVKPWENEKLIATVASAVKLKQSQQEVQRLQTHQKELNRSLSEEINIIGDSDAIKEVHRQIRKVAATDANVLILGENGTGKELVAQAIHHYSYRVNQPFIKIDLGSITESLFESELYGHKKGAFTDAKSDKMGRIVLADNGSLFLDEIGNLSMAMQAKLLSVLQNREVVPVGSNEKISVNIRLISATNQLLDEMISHGEFREDLLYRLNTITIQLPPLRDRTSDIPLLVNHYLNHFGKKYRKETIKPNKTLLDQLSKYHWPGNVRELQHAVERAVIMADSDTLEFTDFAFREGQSNIELDELNLDILEKSAIEKAIKKFNGNMSKAAKELGIGRTTLYRKMEKHNIIF